MNQQKIITIQEGKIKYFHVPNIEIKKENSLNKIIWTFQSEEEEKLQQYCEQFIRENQQWVIEYQQLTLEKQIVNLLQKRRWKISFAESCTGGMLASTIVNVSGASLIFEESFVTYSNEAKIKTLEVSKNIIQKHTVYSPEVAEAMAEGLYRKTKANICISVTGRAGGETKVEADGTFDFAIFVHFGEKEYMQVEHHQVVGSRNDVRKMQTTYILWRTLLLLSNIK